MNEVQNIQWMVRKASVGGEANKFCRKVWAAYDTKFVRLCKRTINENVFDVFVDNYDEVYTFTPDDLIADDWQTFTGVTFEHVIESLRQGCRIRHGRMLPGHYFYISHGCLFTASEDNPSLVPAVFSNAEVFATDWVILED